MQSQGVRLASKTWAAESSLQLVRISTSRQCYMFRSIDDTVDFQNRHQPGGSSHQTLRMWIVPWCNWSQTPDLVRRSGSPSTRPECLSSGGEHASMTLCNNSLFCSFSWLTCSSSVAVYSCLRCRDLAALSRFFTCTPTAAGQDLNKSACCN